ncbi:MAG: hypothetical protein ACK59B_00920 [Alphaproteobacteria bacterium]
MQDPATTARSLFTDFATSHGLSIRTIDEPNKDLLMEVPAQKGLAFNLRLGLQDTDRLNIGFEGLWMHFFPFSRKQDPVRALLDGIVDGSCRLAIHRQFGLVTSRVLERRVDGAWHPVYTAHGLAIPFVPTHVTCIANVQPEATSP